MSEEKAHDVLAAEAFALPAPDPALRHGPIVLPEDPSGISEPHDTLVPEEFAMPAPRPAQVSGPFRRPSGGVAPLGLGVGLLLLALLLRRRGR